MWWIRIKYFYFIEKTVPWKGKLSPVITACANLYTTADGKDLLLEVVCILSYAQIKKVSMLAE